MNGKDSSIALITFGVDTRPSIHQIGRSGLAFVLERKKEGERKKSQLSTANSPGETMPARRQTREMGKAIFGFWKTGDENCQIANSAGETTEIG